MDGSDSGSFMDIDISWSTNNNIIDGFDHFFNVYQSMDTMGHD